MFSHEYDAQELQRVPRRVLALLHVCILGVSLFATGPVTAEHLAAGDYPDMGNVQQGCAGVSRCIVYLSGGGKVTTADIQNDLKVLTAGLPPGVGLIAHRPTLAINLGFGDLYAYSDSDVESLKADAGVYSPQFGSRMVTVGVSEGVRAMRSAISAYGHQVGVWIEIDKFSPFRVLDLPTTKSFQAIVSYSADYPSDIKALYSTGPSDLTPFLSQPHYPIILNPYDGILLKTHEVAISSGLIATNGALKPIMSDDLDGMRVVLLGQLTAQWLAPPTTSGEPGVTAPPQGGPGSPSGGGGVGIESFPAWLKSKKVPHGKPDPH